MNYEPPVSQSGNIFFIILIAIALFAGLSYTVSKGMNGGGGQMSERKAELAATAILDYAQRIERGVNRLRRNGCSESELSFEYDEDNDGVYNDNGDSYYNANASSDFSCHLFHPSGANITHEAPDPTFLDSANSSYAAYGEYFFPDLVQIVGIGEDCATATCTDLILDLPHIKLEICEAINKKANLNLVSESIANHAYANSRKYKGAFDFVTISATSRIGDGTGANVFPSGQSFGCIYRSGTTSIGRPYVFYYTLLAR